MKTKEELIDEIVEQGVTLTDFIDYVIKRGGIIGVGLITLAAQVHTYIENKIN